jgi:outer membrane protein OmpA-like peptidoglycan-associated protein
MKPLLKLIFLFSSINLFGQNLIVNPGLEEITSDQNSASFDVFSARGVMGWYMPTLSEPEYENPAVYHSAHSGRAYVSFYLLNTISNDGRETREYCGGTLTQPLEAGKEYKFSVAVSTSYYYDGIKELGVYFSKDQVFQTRYDTISKSPQLILNYPSNKSIFDDYVIMRGTYKASGGELFFVIGNFNSNKRTVIIRNPNKSREDSCCYYYFDDFSLKASRGKIDTEEDSLEDLVTTTKEVETKDTLDIVPGKKLVVKNIYFDANKSSLKEESFPILDEIVSAMKAQPNLKVEINGYTDYPLSSADNQKLSEARAKAVADYLVSKGIRRKRVTSKGHGYEAQNSEGTEEGRVNNKRVEFIFR